MAKANHPKKKPIPSELNKKKPTHPILKRELYENFRLIDPENEFLSFIPRKRFHWYIRKGLGKQIDETTVQLTFQPKNKSTSEFQKERLENLCVVCGGAENLTKHHIVPYEYRKYFRLSYKSRNAYDIVGLCSECHAKYEIKASKLKLEIGNEYGACLGGQGIIHDIDKAKIKRLAASLLHARNKMPSNRRKEVEANLSQLCQTNIYKEDGSLNLSILKEYASLKIVDKTRYISHGELVVTALLNKGSTEEEKNTLMQDFVIMWRKHFVENTSPKFMSSSWNVNQSIL